MYVLAVFAVNENQTSLLEFEGVNVDGVAPAIVDGIALQSIVETTFLAPTHSSFVGWAKETRLTMIDSSERTNLFFKFSIFMSSTFVKQKTQKY